MIWMIHLGNQCSHEHMIVEWTFSYYYYFIFNICLNFPSHKFFPSQIFWLKYTKLGSANGIKINGNKCRGLGATNTSHVRLPPPLNFYKLHLQPLLLKYTTMKVICFETSYHFYCTSMYYVFPKNGCFWGWEISC